jgi:hypothetical protein
MFDGGECIYDYGQKGFLGLGKRLREGSPIDSMNGCWVIPNDLFKSLTKRL